MSNPTDPALTATIVEWNDQKGFGFLQVGNKRVFLHRNDFAERHKRPEVGDLIRFTPGKDAQGRPCAQNAAHMNDGGRITPLVMVVLAGLLVLPVVACWRQGAPVLWIGLWVVVASLVSLGVYVADKHRARAGDWRISEAGLHLTELLGGWPGAFLAQRHLRHKVSKFNFQVVFWGIVLGYQLVACDSLQDWKLSRAAWHRISQHGTGTMTAPKTPVIEIITNTGTR